MHCDESKVQVRIFFLILVIDPVVGGQPTSPLRGDFDERLLGKILHTSSILNTHSFPFLFFFLILLFIYFSATPTGYGSSWAKDRRLDAAETSDP